MISETLDEVILQITKSNADTSEYVKRMLDVMEYDVPYTSNSIMELLGLKSLVVKAHGSSKRKEICACLKQVETFYKKDIANKIQEGINK